MKKHLIIPLIILFILILLFGVSLVTKSNENQITELKFRITWDQLSSRGIAINKIVESYNTSQNKIHVTMVGGNEEHNDFVSLLNTDDIDVYMIPYRYIRDHQISDELLLLTELFSEKEDSYYESIKSLAKSDKGIVAIPWIGHSMGLIYNKDITDLAGVDPNSFRSIDDLLNACETINKKTGHKGLGLVGADSHDLTWMMSQFIYSFGGKLTETNEKNQQTSILINSQESKDAVNFYINKLGKYAQEGWQEHTGLEVMEAFRNSEIAFEIQGPWGITDIWKCGCKFDVKAISLTQMNMYSEVGPLMLSISKDSKNIESSKDFIRYLTNKNTLERIMDGEYDDKYEEYYPYRIPLNKDMDDSMFFKKYPEFLVFIEGYNKASINTPTTVWAEDYKDLYSYYIHQAILKNITIDEALESIANKKAK